MAFDSPRRVPGSTYRVQLHGGFTFADLEGVVPYLRALGVTDCYCSPIFLSTPGSTHGYDVSDYRRINPELGGEEGLKAAAGRLREHGLGLLLDFVPNHMGINGPFNRWWLDVLEHGRRSPYARFFDVHWKGEGDERGRILVPVLEDHYGVVLEAGGLRLCCEDGALRVHYGSLHFPLKAASCARVLEPVAADPRCPPATGERMRALLGELRAAARPDGAALTEEALARLDAARAGLRDCLEGDPAAARLLEARLGALNGRAGSPRSFDELDSILQEQHYRLARWKTGVYAANYRRFFAIDTLVGLRVEHPEVFAESHALLQRLLREGWVDGLRIDHVDGLWDPRQYLERLQAAARPASGGDRPFYVVVEKILGRGEALPPAWPVHGTTGYEFIAQCARVLTRAAGEAEMTAIYRDFTGQAEPFRELVFAEKHFVLEEMFANTVAELAAALEELLMADRLRRDLTRRELTVAIREIMASLRVYRTYRRLDEPCGEQDRREIGAACDEAVRRNPLRGPGPIQLVRDILLGDYPPPDAPEDYRRRLGRWVLGFQQYTGGVMAKSVEDTAFYVYNRLIALNEVGCDPAEFGGAAADFHADNGERARRVPHGLIASSTHDTKLSEDVRARLYVLSEIPEDWSAWLREWREINRPHKRTVDGQAAPDANEEYRLYQVLLGAWPTDEDAAPDDAFRGRIRAHFRKSVNEAKLNTTWIQPNEAWLAAGDAFIDAVLSPGASRAFLESFRPRAARVAHLGMVNSLVQLVLKLTSPGVPDLYQGNETWDFSLVDPDNRRPVDFAARAALLAEVDARSPRDLLRHWRDGGIKLRATRDLLRFRREHPALFAEGDYVPLPGLGRFADHVVAFRRERGKERLLVVAPRLTAKLGCPPLDLIWEDTAVAAGRGRAWRDVVTGREFEAAPEIPVRRLFADFPFAVLHGRG